MQVSSSVLPAHMHVSVLSSGPCLSLSGEGGEIIICKILQEQSDRVNSESRNRVASHKLGLQAQV